MTRNARVTPHGPCGDHPTWRSIAVATVLLVASTAAWGIGRDLSSQELEARKREPVGAVYTMTNQSSGNEVVAFSRYSDGRIEEVARIATQGYGNDQALSSVGSLALAGERFLLVANPGDSTISAFKINREGPGPMMLELTDRQSSGGTTPISISVRKDLVYVLNAGTTTASIAGFELSEHGDLQAIPGAIASLPNLQAKPTQIEISPKRDAVLVAEAGSDAITVFGIDPHTGAATVELTHTAHPGAGATHLQTPWSMDFDPEGFVFTSEAARSFPGASSVGVHKISMEGDDLTFRSAATSLPIGQTSAHDVAVTKNGRWIFIANQDSDTITSVAAKKVADDRVELRLVVPGGVSAVTGRAPAALSLNRNERYLYSLNSGDGSISAYQVSKNDGGLTPWQQVFGLPSSASGLVSD